MSARQVAGYTLIELMVSLVLGLLITAAAVQLFITGQTSFRVQRALSSIQDNGNFGLNYMVSDIRKANLGASVALMNDQTPFSGVILTQENADKPSDQAMDNTKYPIAAYLTANQLYTSQAMSDSNVTGLNNDQLTIQYVPTQIGYDCAGNQITQTQINNQVHVLQRYFIRADASGVTGDKALACAAAQFYINASGAAYSLNSSGAQVALDLSSLRGDGQIIIPRVDYFHILLGTSTGSFDAPTMAAICANGTTAASAYCDVNSYLALTPTSTTVDGITTQLRPNIRSIQIGLLVRATDSVSNQAISGRNQAAFKVLNNAVSLKTQDAKYLRQVVSQTITFRNALGEGGT